MEKIMKKKIVRNILGKKNMFMEKIKSWKKILEKNHVKKSWRKIFSLSVKMALCHFWKRLRKPNFKSGGRFWKKISMDPQIPTHSTNIWRKVGKRTLNFLTVFELFAHCAICFRVIPLKISEKSLQYGKFFALLRFTIFKIYDFSRFTIFQKATRYSS